MRVYTVYGLHCLPFCVHLFDTYVYGKTTLSKLYDQRTPGPVNAHLTPGPGIYFNAFIHVYSPRASLCPFDASFKTISLKYYFKHILNDFIYSPGARAENPWGTNVLCQQKALIILTICCKFQTNLFEFLFYTYF